MNIPAITPFGEPSDSISMLVEKFLQEFNTLESSFSEKNFLLYDEKSQSYYMPCRLISKEVVDKVDFNATIDGSEEDELYKLNRDITENESAYSTMVSDAILGRPFEDIVVEYDKSYSPMMPLKIYGGQHRVRAIQSAFNMKPDTYHGFRVYFGLNKEQKVEIATINNTSIAVSNDLLDRMKEQLLGSELRDFCQKVGLLEEGQDFADKKDFFIPTVRVARTFVVNYWKGREANRGDFHTPYVCKSGGVDDEYLTVRAKIVWDEKNFLLAGEKFRTLHKTQYDKVMARKQDRYAQFASKAISLSVVASWSFAAGMYFKDIDYQNSLFLLTNSLGTSEDPLNAKALSEARLKGIDPDTYRGLGTRTNSDELGRMLEVFIVLVEKATDKKISKNLANAAIQSYEAKKATHVAAKSLQKL